MQERILRWLHDLDVRRAGRTVDVPGGTVVLHDAFPLAHDHNKLSVVADHDGSAVAEAVEREMGGAGLEHRLVEVRAATCVRLEPGLLARGYQRQDDLLMIYGGSPRRARPQGDVTQLTLAERARAAEKGWADGAPSYSPEVCRQLGERIATVCAAADATFLAVVDQGGTVLARADLYVYEKVAQVEEVATGEQHRGRGLATLLVSEATRRAELAGADVIFLVADADDWPKRLYRSLGYCDGQRLPTFTGAPAS